ncbi:MAG: metallophosphoesterase, partial [Saprospiraceae bacterium]|nr:metallophosphoesterase [Saprospiraceae bacterium]
MSGNSIYIVRPNIGNPQILQVQDLDNIEITIAGTSESIPKLEDIIADLNDIKLEYKNDNQSKEFPLAFKSWLNLPQRYIDDNPDLSFYDESLRLPLFPTSIIEHQFHAGFRWEAHIIVSLIGNRNDFIAKSKSTICNIIKDTRINYHSICVREEMPNPEKINFLHVTDCHISGRNDLIPQLILPVLEPWQKKIFKSRYLNYNDNLRAIIRYANQRAREGNLDFIIITGDLIDYLHDGYFSGDTYHYGQGKDAPTIPDNTRSNYTKFIEIITGTDNKGEELQVPVFTIPGNHEYYAYENLGAFNIDLEKEVPDWLIFIRVISTILFPVNIVLDLIAPEMYDLRKTGKVDDKVNDDIDKYGTFG